MNQTDCRAPTVLVVDDFQEIRDMVRRCLALSGFDVVCASTGHEAAQLLKARRFDLLVTDVLMPDGDGLELITQVRKDSVRTPVLAMAGGGNYLGSEQCLEMAKFLGADATLSKPFEFPRLMEVIARLVPVAAGQSVA